MVYLTVSSVGENMDKSTIKLHVHCDRIHTKPSSFWLKPEHWQAWVCALGHLNILIGQGTFRPPALPTTCQYTLGAQSKLVEEFLNTSLCLWKACKHLVSIVAWDVFPWQDDFRRYRWPFPTCLHNHLTQAKQRAKLESHMYRCINICYCILCHVTKLVTPW